MMLLQNQDWRQDYDRTVIRLIHETFPPDQYLAEVDGTQLIQAAGAESDTIIRDFAHKTWEQLDHAFITRQQDAPLSMSYEGFLKFLPAYLVDLFDPETQVQHVVWNCLLEYRSETRSPHEPVALNDDQLICCILSFVRSSDFPLDTMIPRRTADEYFHNPSPESAFNMLTLGFSHERILRIQSRIEQINDCFVIERWDQG
ncbi:hypothetical protein [Gimesia panareensis]|nr:hypothetical protein [Gimesia panareensis]